MPTEKVCPYATADEYANAVRAAGSAGALGTQIGASSKLMTKWANQLGVDLVALRRERGYDARSADRLGALAKLIEDSGISLDDVARVKSIRVNEWQGMSKGDDGEPVVTDLRAASIVLEPRWLDGPEWPVVQPAAPVTITPAKPRPRASGLSQCVILPDPQIGYRRDMQTGELDPFHDESAMRAAMLVISELQPDLVILLGDVLDLPAFSRHVQEPSFAGTTQAALDRAHAWIAEIRANAPTAEIRMLEGNHDRRLEKSIMQNAAAAFGIQVANAPDSWPVLSIPNLLRLDELGVEYVQGYPAGITYVNSNLAVIHGHKVKSGGSTAAAVINSERQSVIFGHIHRIELQHKTMRTFEGTRTNFAASPGCLCRIDGAVPSTNGATDVFGRPVQGAENWQQGFAVVSYDAEAFHLELVPIHAGRCLFRGREYADA